MDTPPARPPERASRELRVPVTPVGARGGPGRAAVLAAIAVVVVIAGSVASSDLFPVGPAPIATIALVAPPSSTASAPPTGTPSPAPLPTGPLTPRARGTALDVAALVAGVRDGTFAGRLVFVDGLIRVKPRTCEKGSPLSSCVTLSIDGLRGLRVVPDDDLGTWTVAPARGESLVLLVRDATLVYLGSVLVDPAGIPQIDLLLARLERHDPGAAAGTLALYEADGLVIGNGFTVCQSGGDCHTSWRLVPSLTDMALGAGTDVTMSMLGAIDTWDGPFLLRRRPDRLLATTWQVVAPEDQASIVHIVIP